jgi:hypothetical protein
MLYSHQETSGGLIIPSDHHENWAGIDLHFGPRKWHGVGPALTSQWKVNVSTLIRERGLPRLRVGHIPVKGVYSKGKDAHGVGTNGKGMVGNGGKGATPPAPQEPRSAAAEVATQVTS